jgi:hypothetical protein
MSRPLMALERWQDLLSRRRVPEPDCYPQTQTPPACRQARRPLSRPACMALERWQDLLSRRRVPEPDCLSSDPDTTCLPSGEKATEQIPSPYGPRASAAPAPVAASQSRIVISSDPDTTCLPSGENAMNRPSPCGPRASAGLLPSPCPRA